jgi:release factor glutamine methyltransferase
MMTVADVTRLSVATLVKAGFAHTDAHRDIAVLVRHLLEWDTAAWLSRQRDAAPAELGARLDLLVSRRALGEPVAYLCGTREFYGRAFTVTRDVLIPRPDTELLCERVLSLMTACPAGRASPVIVDVGTGSGCIAVTLAAGLPGISVVATDTSAAALEVAAGNATRHGVAGRIRFVEGPLVAGASGVDVVVSNPPYIPEGDRAGLMRDVRDFEPASALFAGQDGLDVIRPLISAAWTALRAGGMLALEIGAGQADAVVALMTEAGFIDIRTTHDLAGIPRTLEGVRRPASV